MARIQNDIQKIRTTSGPSPTTRAKSKKLLPPELTLNLDLRKANHLRVPKLEEIERVGDKIKN